MTWSPAKLGLALAITSGLGVACSLVFPLNGYGPGEPFGGAVDAGDDAPPPDSALDAKLPDSGHDAGCPLRRPPDPPEHDDPSQGDIVVTMAFTSVDLGIGANQAPGWDLDGFCTCPGEPSCKAKSHNCDRDGGVDNGVAELLRSANALQGLNIGGLTDSIAAGTYNLLTVVSGYNGTANDRHVSVAMLPSGGTPTNDGGVHQRASFDGGDVWQIYDDTTDAGVPVLNDPTAYVARGILVWHLGVPIGISNGSQISVHVDDGVFAGTFAKEKDQLWHVRAGISDGRWATEDALVAISSIPDPFDGTQYLCGTDPAYQLVRLQLCGGVDIMADPADDGTGKDCNAISTGFLFEMLEAKVGATIPSPIGFDRCGKDYHPTCAN